MHKVIQICMLCCLVTHASETQKLWLYVTEVT